MIQRLTASSPSPAYVLAAADAFRSGTFTSGDQTFGAGRYGDLAATVAAVLLHPEAADGAKLREPVLKIAHALRALEYQSPTDGYFHLYLNNLAQKVGQEPFLSPSVFNYYMPDH